MGRRRLAAVVLGCLLATGLVLASAPSREEGPGPSDGSVAPPAPGDSYRFVSAPDFMNADIADLRGSPRWRPGLPNSWNASWARATDTVMDSFEAERPDDVLVAGDLVNGHWGTSPTEVFGPVTTVQQRRAATRRAAAVYYPAWRQRFAARGLSVRPAIGDHEIGDNDWSGSPVTDRKRRLVPLFKTLFADYVVPREPGISRPPGPARRSAYALRPAPDVLLVSVDTFELTGSDVVPRLDPQQLRWVAEVLAEAREDGVRWTLVQGHVPVAQPVRAASSSELAYEGGTSSAFWRTLARYDVDLYLAGEVHDITTIERDGVVQLTHGGMLWHGGRRGIGGTSFVVGQTTEDTLELTAKRFRVPDTDADTRLWQTTGQGRPPLRKTFATTPDVVGTLRLDGSGAIVGATGRLAPREDG